MFEDSNECAIVWGSIVIPLSVDVKSSFGVLVKAFYVFGVSAAPCDKHFFLFICGAVMGVEKMTTTGSSFLRAVT